MPIRAIHRGSLGRRFMGRRPGRVFVLLPDPVDADACLKAAGFTGFADADEAWDREFEQLVGAAVAAMTRRFGEASVSAPTHARHPAWVERLDSFCLGLLLGRSRPQPATWTPTQAMQNAATDDQLVPFALVGFGDAAYRHGVGPRAALLSGGGHPLLWFWLDDELADAWPEIADEVSQPWSSNELELAWEPLVPAIPMLARELPRVALHRGDAISWTDGEHVLGFNAGLGVSPAEVYVPTESSWSASAPVWASTLRATIVRDFEASGVRVVAHEGAGAFDDFQKAR